MDQMRLLVALVLSFLVFMLWNVFFGQETKQRPAPQLQQDARVEEKIQPKTAAAPPEIAAPDATKPELQRPARQITVETPLYKVGLTEKGASINSFVLKRYHASVDPGSPLQNLLPEKGPLNSLFVGMAGVPALEDAVFQANLNGDQLSLTDGSRELAVRIHRGRRGPDGEGVPVLGRLLCDRL